MKRKVNSELDWHYEDLRLGASFGILGSTLYNSNRVKVIESESLGTTLYIDDSLQTCEFDEYIYHEMIAHPPMQLHINPRKVLIVGGGDGGTLREVLRYDTVQHIDIVEINKMVCDVSCEYLEFTKLKENLKNPKVNLHIGCGSKFLKNPDNSEYDVIIIDCGDPNDESRVLYSKDFVDLCWDRTSGDGIVNFQSQYYLGSLDFIRHFKRVCCDFFDSSYYHCPIPSYPLGGIGFTLLVKSRNINLKTRPIDCKYYSNKVFEAAHTVPKSVHENRIEKNINSIRDIFNWREFLLGIDLEIVNRFTQNIDGEYSISPINQPVATFTVGKDDGRPYYKLRFCTDVASDKLKKNVGDILRMRGIAPLVIDGVRFSGVEWDSRDNRKLDLIYLTDMVEIVGEVNPMIPAFFPDDFYSKGLIIDSSNGVSVEISSPKCWYRIDSGGVSEERREVSEGTAKSRLFKEGKDQIDELKKRGMKLHSMAYVDFKNYELTFGIA